MLALMLLAYFSFGSLADGTNCQEVEGNYYCNNVSAITYNNFCASGTYDQVVDMNGCKTKPVAYSGPLAPLDEEVSICIHSSPRYVLKKVYIGLHRVPWPNPTETVRRLRTRPWLQVSQ